MDELTIGTANALFAEIDGSSRERSFFAGRQSGLALGLGTKSSIGL